MLKITLIIKVKPRIFAASLSSFGRTIVASYLSEDTMVTILKILRKTAIAPKSSGVYILRKKGWSINGIAWATTVPLIKISVFFEKSDFGKKRFNIGYYSMNKIVFSHHNYNFL